MTINDEMGVEEFVKRIKDSIDKNPTNRYLFFIGAGCSIPSGIPGAEKLSNKWLKELKYFLQPNAYSKWCEDNIGSNNNSSMAKFYSTIIKKRFPIKSDRQQEMERLIDNGKESFGYVVLAHLLTSKKYGKNFNIVFTTNFDNLIAESIYRYTSEKARIISHDSLMSFVNIQSHKPQIVKLHGDVEFDQKNTEEETFKLNDDALETVKHTLTNCGLIFVGYGGNDKSIINSLVQISEKSITNGIFWVRNALPESKLKDWLNSREHSFWIKHSNFDQLMMYFLKYFDIPRPDKKRCLEAESDFQKSLEALGKQIENTDTPKKNQLKKIFRKYVSSVDDWVNLVIEANEISKKDFQKAVKLYEVGVKKFPNNTSILHNFGDLYLDVEKNEEAIKWYDKALEIDPDGASTLSNKGTALDRMGEHEEAIKYHDKSLEVRSDNVPTLSNKGLAFDSMGKYEEAIKWYDKALEIDPNNPITISNKGLAFYNMSEYEEAIQWYDMSLEIRPDNMSTTNNKGFALYSMGKYEEAIKWYDKALEIDPDDVITMSNKGTALDRMGKYGEAKEIFQKITVSADPQRRLSYRIGIAFDYIGNSKKSLKYFNYELIKNKRDKHALHRKGLALVHLKEYENAFKCYDDVLHIDPKFKQSIYHKASLQSILNNKKESLKLLTQAINLNPWYRKTINLKDFENIKNDSEFKKIISSKSSDPKNI